MTQPTAPASATVGEAHAALTAKLARLTNLATEYIQECGGVTQAASAMAAGLREIPSCVLAALLATELVHRAQTSEVAS